MVPWASEINHSPVLQAIEKTLDIMLDLSWIRGPILRLYLRYDLRKRALAIAAPQNFCTRTFQPQDAFGEQEGGGFSLHFAQPAPGRKPRLRQAV